MEDGSFEQTENLPVSKVRILELVVVNATEWKYERLLLTLFQSNFN